MSTSPRRLGKYELLQLTGKGHLGEVWQAHDLSQKRDVALKLFHSDLQADPHFLDRFTNGSRVLTSLRQDNLVSVYEATIVRPDNARETTAFIAMDYIEGYTLKDYLQATSHRGIFPPMTEVLYVFFKIGTALDHLHRNGVIHSNIKPTNILLNKNQRTQFVAGEPLLTDVGITQIVGNESLLNAPQYVSPEQAQGQFGSYSSDLYALGIILYELCTGIVPFRSENTATILTQHIHTLPMPPVLINSSMPPVLSEVILRAIAKDPAMRFPSAAALTGAIAEACSLKPTFQLPQLPISAERVPATEKPSDPAPAMLQSILGVPQPLTTASPVFIRPLQSIAERQASMSQIPLDSVANDANIQPPISIPPPISGPISMSSGSLQSPSGNQFIARPSFRSDAHIINTNHASQESAYVPNNSPETPHPFMPLESPFAPISSLPATPSSNPDFQAMPDRMQYIPAQPMLQPLPFPQTPHPQAPQEQSIPASNIAFKNSAMYKVVVAIILLFVLIGGSLVFLHSTNNINTAQTSATDQTQLYGKAFFQDDALGLNDQLHIAMQNIPDPSSGNEYFAWLQTDKQQSIPLGLLAVKNKEATLTYQGDSQHSDLLSYTQGIIVTLEQANSAPDHPSAQIVYHASFTQNTLSDLKNILYVTPELPDHQGVAIDLLNTIKSMNDKASSVVDSLQNTRDDGLAERQATRVIEMIDGTNYAQASGDLPAAIPAQINSTVGLLSSPTQKGYIDIFIQHLNELKAQASNNQTVLMRIQNVENALNDIQNWTQKMRTYDVQILKAASNLDDPTTVNSALQLKQIAAYSYTGRIIPPDTSPTTKIGSAGAQQAYAEAQYMAELDLTAE